MARVGLEIAAPGSPDAGGAWLLDLPGCFSPGADEREALGGLPAAIARHRRVLGGRGVRAPEIDGTFEVVERFTSSWEESISSGRYEINAIFTADLGPTTPAEVAYRRAALAASREELLVLASRAGAGRQGDRSVAGMLGHVATAEWFYATRLEDDPRAFEGFRREDLEDPRERLAAIRAWVLPRLDTLPALGAIERVHRGERWTPRKILRRFIYHELDHIRELEARVPAEVR